MKNLASSLAIRHLVALVLSVAFLAAGMTAAAAPGYGGQTGERSAFAAAVAHGHAHHASHHMPAGDPDAECCDTESTAAASCHASVCCVSELQYPDTLTFSAYAHGSRARFMEIVAGPSIDRSLPDRPPRTA